MRRASSVLGSTIALLICLLAGLPGDGAQIPVGGEFQVNTHTLNDQRYPSVAEGGTGFVVVWETLGQDDPASAGVFGRRLNGAGSPVATEFQISVRTTGNQARPDVAGASDGGFVVVWQSNDQDGANYGVFARRFDSAGSPVGGEFQVNTYTPLQQFRASVEVSADGDFAVVWASNGQDGSTYGIFGRRFASSGSPLAGEFQVNSFTLNSQRTPEIAVFEAPGPLLGDVAAGSVLSIRGGSPTPTPIPSFDQSHFVVAWEKLDYAPVFDIGSRLRRFDDGGLVGSEFQLRDDPVVFEALPKPAVFSNGALVAAFMTFEGSEFGAQSQIFDSSGNSLGVFPIHDPALGSFDPTVEATEALEALYAYAAPVDGLPAGGPESEPRAVPRGPVPAAGLELMIRTFDSTGTPQTAPLQVNLHTPNNQHDPDLAARDDGSFVVVWQSANQDGGGAGIFTRGLATLAIDDIDGDARVQPLIDGLLKLRWLFGFRGSALVAGAVDTTDCTRCTAAAIELYLQSITSLLDIDGSGQPPLPLTDGLLNLRWLFGFRGAVLIAGAVDTNNCTRCTAQAIEAYLDMLD